MTRASIKHTVLAAAVGFGAAMATTALRTEPAAPSQPATKRPGRAHRITVTQHAQHRLSRRLASRVARLEHRVAGNSDEREPGAEDTAPRPHLDRATAIARVRDAARRRSDAHYADSFDASWARDANQSVRGDLKRIEARAGFDIVEVDCRTRLCRIDLDWPSYDDAQTGAAMLAPALRSLNCRIHVMLPPPDDRGARYSSATYLDCSALRAGTLPGADA